MATRIRRLLQRSGSGRAFVMTVAPDGASEPCEDLVPLARALRVQPEIAAVAEQTERRFQITLQAKRTVRSNRLWDLTHQAVLLSGCSNRDGYSIRPLHRHRSPRGFETERFEPAVRVYRR